MAQAKWFWGLASPATGAAHGAAEPGAVFMELPKARGRRLTLRIDPTVSDEAVFTMSGTDPGGEFIGDLDTDLVCQRGDEVLFRGRIGVTGDTLDALRHDSTYTAMSYRELLKRRSLSNLTTLSYTGADQSDIVWALMDYTQSQTNGDMGIERGTGAAGTGVARTVAYSKGDFIFDNIAALAQADDGFDWNVTCVEDSQDLRLHIWEDGLKVDKGFVLEWGSSMVKSAVRAFDPSAYGNKLYAMGDPSAALTPVSLTGADLATFAGGRFESVVTTNDTVQATLASRAAWILKTLGQRIPSWQVTLAAGAWDGPDQLMVGDVVWWRARSGRVSENKQYRVVQLDLVPNDAGGETVTVGLGMVPRTVNRIIAKIVRTTGGLPQPTPVGP